ncbi:MAG: GtrA family protein [Gammaproteobacteria bacterium]
MSELRPPSTPDSTADVARLDRGKRCRQFARFCMTGAISTAIYYGLYLLMLPLLPAVGAYAVGYSAGVAFNLCMHMLITFRTGFHWRLLFGFLLVYLVSMAIGALVLRALVGLGVSVQIAGFLVVFANLFFNFGGMRALALRTTETAPRRARRHSPNQN